MFDIMNSSHLISAVRKRPALWDPKHIGHNNRLLIHKLWMEVAEEVGIDKNLAKSKWRSLRDYYRQEMKKETNFTNEQGAMEYRSSWALFDQISFIKDTILTRKYRETTTSNNTNEMDVDNSSGFSEDDPFIIPKLEPELDISYSVVNHSRISPPVPLEFHDKEKESVNNKSNKTDYKQRENLTNNDIIDRNSIHLERALEEFENDDLQFFRSLLPDLVNLPRSKKSYIRLKIQEIIYKEVYNNEGIVENKSS